jgi:uncharacterized protein (DUF1684 family)
MLVLAACERAPAPVDPEAHRAAVEAWRQSRLAALTRPDGWLSLVGLFWMERGRSYTLGGDTANDFVYAGVDGSVPPRIGTFTTRERGVRFDAEPGLTVTLEGNPVTSIEAAPDSGPAPVLELGSLQFLVLRRSGEYAVRVRDAESPVRTDFPGIETFPVSTTWRLPARFEWKEPPDTIDIPNILGTVNATPSPATVRFDVDGRTYRIALWKDSDDPANFFTAFADATNAAETYGGGRFLWVDAPDQHGRTTVDFNKAYNPPCVFTEFATCPLPPQQNRLPFSIPAGEKVYEKYE